MFGAPAFMPDLFKRLRLGVLSSCAGGAVAECGLHLDFLAQACKQEGSNTWPPGCAKIVCFKRLNIGFEHCGLVKTM